MEGHVSKSTALEVCFVQAKLWWNSGIQAYILNIVFNQSFQVNPQCIDHFIQLIGTRFSELRIVELATDLITPNVLYELANKAPKLQYLTLGLHLLNVFFNDMYFCRFFNSHAASRFHRSSKFPISLKIVDSLSLGEHFS